MGWNVSNQTNAGITAVLLVAGFLGGCATPPPASDPEASAEYNRTNDPGEPSNRNIFAFNDFADENVIAPTAEGYRTAVPAPAREGIRNFLNNLNEPLVLVNDLLQGEGTRAGETFGRFLMNSTVGFLGFFDTAEDSGFASYHEEDFGQTLAIWGLPEGPYVVLPLLGPSNVRDASGKVVDYFMDPVSIFIPGVPLAASMSKTGVAGVDKREEHLDGLKDVKKTSLDYYASLRSLYRQRRAEDIRNGTGISTLPDPDLGYDAPTTEGSISQR